MLSVMRVNDTPRRHPRTLIEAFPDSPEAARWLERHRASWRWSRPLGFVLCTAAAGLAVLALVAAVARAAR